MRAGACAAPHSRSIVCAAAVKDATQFAGCAEAGS